MVARCSGRVTAVLGPTNTGKTYLAMERMLGYASGMIGFPLRLLARENYDRIVRIKGKGAVALVTGEERIIPPHPSWFVCTVEAMPLDRAVEFLAVDEIQLVGDPERGHVFTERLLTARGLSETMFMGSETVKPLLKRLVPEAEIVSRPRFSTLSYTGPRKVTRLPPRSAVVAFSVADVFELAELVRRQRGGTAVVLGALSPRARNAQVAMYQAGEVDYMVATDAIGMGLNMDLDHVAFARLTKFDGRMPRRLKPAEIGQIAGRAGRHMNDGTFGTTAEAGPLDPEIVEAVEAHRFDPLAQLWWRNDALDFRSPQLLLRSLEVRPPFPVMLRKGDADDQQALEILARDPDVLRSAASKPMVRLLWDVCQIPDFRKVMSDQHARLLTRVFQHLSEREGRLPAEWIAQQMQAIERTDGDIDTLVQRIAYIRTWTYITHRPGWLDDAAHWQERAIGIEDKLSDALHDRITQRFVDRRSASLVRHLAQAKELTAVVSRSGEVLVEGHYVGEMQGFRFVPDNSVTSEASRTLLTAANRVLPAEVQARARALSGASDESFDLALDGAIMWEGGPAVARLVPGENPLSPRVELLPADFLDGPVRDEVRRRLDRFVRERISRILRPLGAVPPSLGPAARGLLFRLGEALGTLSAAAAEEQVRELSAEDRKVLGALGVRFGRTTLYVDRLLKPAPIQLRALLWSVFRGAAPPPLPPPGRVSVLAGDARKEYWQAIGFGMAGTHAIRVDRLEALTAALRKLAREAPFALTGDLARLAGIPLAELPAVVEGLGFRACEVEGALRYAAPAERRRRKTAPQTRAHQASADHPFSKLRELELAR